MKAPADVAMRVVVALQASSYVAEPRAKITASAMADVAVEWVVASAISARSSAS